MPTCSSPVLKINYKSISLFTLLLLSPLLFYAQSLTGLWVGTMSNDSSTVRKDQSYEIALTEYRGKVYGYSRSEFIVNDTLYYMMKRVKGTIKGDICEVKDDEIISYNFPGKLDKGVKLSSTFIRNEQDSTWSLQGEWKTNATKKYYAVTGKIELIQEKDLSASKIFPHLEELKRADDVAFYKERKIEEVQTRIVKPERAAPMIAAAPNLVEGKTTIGAPIASTPAKITVQPVVEKTEEKKVIVTAKAENIPPQNNGKPATTEPVVAKSKPAPAPQKQPSTTVQKEPVAKTVEKKEVKQTAPPAKEEVVKISPPAKETAVAQAIEKKVDVAKVDVIAKSSMIAGRKSAFSQEVIFKSDSLQLALYDNGEIDGDTVSIYMNGELMMAHEGLKSSAIRKTIYLPAGTEEFTLVMFAESLGKYPPNTGLLVIKDGNDVYNLRFSSDFKNSSGIIFRRKK